MLENLIWDKAVIQAPWWKEVIYAVYSHFLVSFLQASENLLVCCDLASESYRS